MRKLAIFSVKIRTENGDEWSRSFVGRPDNSDVVEAILADRDAALAEPKARTGYINSVYGNFRTLILDHGVSAESEFVCKYAGVQVGRISVRKVSSIFDMKAQS